MRTVIAAVGLASCQCASPDDARLSDSGAHGGSEECTPDVEDLTWDGEACVGLLQCVDPGACLPYEEFLDQQNPEAVVRVWTCDDGGHDVEIAEYEGGYTAMFDPSGAFIAGRSWCSDLCYPPCADGHRCYSTVMGEPRVCRE